MRALCCLFALSVSGAAVAQEVPCGGDFQTFKAGLQDEAVAMGHDPQVARRFLSGAQQDGSGHAGRRDGGDHGVKRKA